MKIDKIVIICLIVSCSQSADFEQNECDSVHNVGEFESSKIFTLDTEGLQYQNFSNHVLKLDSGTYLASFDRQSHAINYFELNSGVKKFTTYLGDDGPNMIIEPAGFYYHNLDSIFVTRFGYFDMTLINYKGEVIDRWDFISEETPDSLLLDGEATGNFGLGAINQYGINFFYDEKKKMLNLHANIVVRNGDNSFPYTYQLPVLAIYDIDTEKVKRFFGRYPLSYLDDNIPHDLFLSFAKGDDKTVISYPSSDRLVIVGRDSTYEKCAKSKFVDRSDFYFYDKGDGGEVEDFWNQYIASASYDRLIFDNYRDQYYRIVKHAIPEKDPEGLRNERESAPWSVMVLDTNLDVIKEVAFPPNTYDFTNIHVIDKGVLVSKSNFLSEEFSEDEIVFELINFQ